MKTADLDKRVDLYFLLRVTWGIHSYAAENLINHGRVTIDGHVVQARWARNHWRVRQLRGRVLKCPRGEIVLYGSRPDRGEIVSEQLELGRNA